MFSRQAVCFLFEPDFPGFSLYFSAGSLWGRVPRMFHKQCFPSSVFRRTSGGIIYYEFRQDPHVF